MSRIRPSRVQASTYFATAIYIIFFWLRRLDLNQRMWESKSHVFTNFTTPHYYKRWTLHRNMFTKLYESQKGLCEDRSLIFSTKHFVPDLRLAKYYSQHIRSMVTTNLSNGERPQGFSPPLIWCNKYYTQPFYWPYRTLFTCNFQKAFRNLVTFSSFAYMKWFYILQWLRFPYSHQQLVLYTYFYASPQNGLFGITYSGYPRHKDNI